jgi:hypothetical protein
MVTPAPRRSCENSTVILAACLSPTRGRFVAPCSGYGFCDDDQLTASFRLSAAGQTSQSRRYELDTS